jgi:colanic acid biosynthesis glycosyl transferase WcaI
VSAAPDPLAIAILGLNYAPEEIGIARYTTGMAEALVQRGMAVEVIAGAPYYPQWQIYQGFGGWWRRTVEQGVALTRCPHYVPANPSGLKRIIHLASFALSALPLALGWALRPRARRPQVVMALAPALLSVPVAWLGARLAGAKLWVHIQDFEVEAALATGLVEAGALGRLALWVERRILALADVVSTISPQMVARLAAKGLAPARLVELRNWADATIAPDPAGGAAYRAEWALGDRQIALYSGNIGNKQGIEILVEAARLLADRRDLTFVICGQGPNRAALEARAAGLDNIQFHDLQPAARMGELLALAAVHLLPQIPGAADLVLPSKLTNMLASSRPVVATVAPGTGLAAEVEGCGLVSAPGDAAALADAITTLLGDADLAARCGAAARERALHRWSQQAIIDRLAQRLRGLTG